MGTDLDTASREQLIEEAKELQNGIREHRDSTGHDRCWYHTQPWGALPEKKAPLPVVAAWPKFMAGRIRYRQSRDEKLPDVPRSDAGYTDFLERGPSMTPDRIFVPAVIKVLMTALIDVRLVTVETCEPEAGGVDKTRSALRETAWSEAVLQVNNNIRNLFELPALFYVMAVILWMLDAVHRLAVAAASLFGLSHIAHTLVHLGTNYVPNRRQRFAVG